MPLKTKHDWALAFGTAIVSVLGTLGVMRADFLEFRASQLEIAYDRIAQLEDRVDSLGAMVVAKDAEIALLNLRMTGRPDSFKGLKYVLNGLGVPAWAKEYIPSEDTFRMAHLNFAYTEQYDVTAQKYIGKRDRDIHPPSAARKYEFNDRQVLHDKDFQQFIEPAYLDTPEGVIAVPTLFWKFYVRLDDGREFIVGMMVRRAIRGLDYD